MAGIELNANVLKQQGHRCHVTVMANNNCIYCCRNRFSQFVFVLKPGNLFFDPWLCMFFIIITLVWCTVFEEAHTESLTGTIMMLCKLSHLNKFIVTWTRPLLPQRVNNTRTFGNSKMALSLLTGGGNSIIPFMLSCMVTYEGTWKQLYIKHIQRVCMYFTQVVFLNY